MERRIVGSPVQRKEVGGKLNGTARYVDDIQVPGMLHGVTIRSTIPRGRILDIKFLPGVPWDEIVVVTATDIPGANVVSLINDDQPCLAHEIVNHHSEPILLLAHADKDIVRRARELVQITYDPLPAVFDMDEALRREHVIWGDDNVFKRYLMNKGNVDAAWEQAAYIVEGEYSTGAQEHVYIEPNGMFATANRSDGVCVRGSLQCPFYVHKALLNLFALPADKVRVVQQETGGAFGGKEEYPPGQTDL